MHRNKLFTSQGELCVALIRQGATHNFCFNQAIVPMEFLVLQVTVDVMGTLHHDIFYE